MGFGFFKIFSGSGNSSEPKVDSVNQEVVNSVPSNCVMVVEDVFSIMGKGVVVTGTILRNSINLNDTLIIMETGKMTQVIGIEVFRKQLETASSGMNVGLLLKDVTRDEIKNSYKLLK